MSYLRRQYDNQRAREQEQDFRNRDLRKAVERDQLVISNSKSDERVEHRRRVIGHHQYSKEAEMERQIEERRQKRERMKEEREEDERIAAALQAQRDERLKEEKLIQLVREESEEIRALESKLRAAAMMKGRAAQLEQVQLQKEIEKVEQEALSREWEAQAKAADEKESKLAQERLVKMHHGRLELEEQIQMKEHEAYLEEQRKASELKEVEEVVQRMREQEEAEMTRHLLKKEEDKRFINEYLDQRREVKEAEARELKLEDERIMKYAKQQAARANQQAEYKEILQQEKDAIYAMLSSDMQRREMELAALEELRLVLSEDIVSKEWASREKALLEKQEKLRTEMVVANNIAREEKKKRQEKEQRDEENIRIQMMEKMAEDDRIEQLNQQKRRMKQAEHRREVETIMQIRRQAAVEEEEKIQREMNMNKEMEEFKLRIIEKERQRLIKEYVPEVIDYLPKGVLSSEKDISLLPQNMQSQLRGQVETQQPGPATPIRKAQTSTRPW